MNNRMLSVRLVTFALALIALLNLCASAEIQPAACPHSCLYIWEDTDYSSEVCTYLDAETHQITRTILSRTLSCNLCYEDLQTIRVNETVTNVVPHSWGNWDTPAENILECYDCGATRTVNWPCSHKLLTFAENGNLYCYKCYAEVVLNEAQTYCSHSNRTVYYPGAAYTHYAQWSDEQHLKVVSRPIYETTEYGIDADCNDCGIWIVCDLNGNIDYVGNTDRISWESNDTCTFEDHAYPGGVCACGRTGENTCRETILPNDLTDIRAEAFLNSDIEYVVFPDSVKTVGARAFANCSSLYMVVMTDSVETIAEDAFSGSAQSILSAPTGSAAHAYAEAHGLRFIPLD